MPDILTNPLQELNIYADSFRSKIETINNELKTLDDAKNQAIQKINEEYQIKSGILSSQRNEISSQLSNFKSQFLGLEKALNINQSTKRQFNRDSFAREQPNEVAKNIAEIKRILEIHGKPMHINEIIRLVDQPLDNKVKIIARIDKRPAIFKRTSPAHYGLVGWAISL